MNIITYIIMDLITYPYQSFSLSMFVKRALEVNPIDRTAPSLTLFGIHRPIGKSHNETRTNHFSDSTVKKPSGSAHLYNHKYTFLSCFGIFVPVFHDWVIKKSL